MVGSYPAINTELAPLSRMAAVVVEEVGWEQALVEELGRAVGSVAAQAAGLVAAQAVGLVAAQAVELVVERGQHLSS